MIDPDYLYKLLQSFGSDFYCGVPDSILRNFSSYLEDISQPENHIIAANEGNAVALAAGKFLSTGRIPIVYLQNSGLGNIVNPVMSLCHKKVYQIPIIFLIGWRGAPDTKDEPQHLPQGQITIDILNSLEIPYLVVEKNQNDLKPRLLDLLQNFEHTKHPVAVLVKKDTLSSYQARGINPFNYEITREQAIKTITTTLSSDTVYVSSTGMISRELYEIREASNKSHEKDFYNVGAMGHASSIALGVALSNKSKKIICLDGDGSLLMHLGSAGIIGTSKCLNFGHVVINNGKHDSVGGQPTVGFKIDIPAMAQSLGYKKSFTVDSESQLLEALEKLKLINGPWMLEVKVNGGSRPNLGRPSESPFEASRKFMDYFQND